MIVGVCEITLHLSSCHSLKEKRQIIKSLLARIRNQFEVAAAEVAEQDRWQLAKLGVSSVSNDRKHTQSVLEHVRSFIEETRPDVTITQFEVELMNW